MTEDGKEIDFYNHRYLWDIYNDWSPKIVCLKAAQICFTVTAIIKAIYVAKHKKMNIVYTLPSEGDINDIVSSKVNGIINNNAILQEWIQDKDSIQQKRVGELKQEKLEALNVYVNAQFKAYLEKYPDLEVQSFTVKSAEAARIAVNPETPLSDTPYLSALTNNDLTARNELAEAVNAKVKENAELEAFAVQTRDAIKACKTQEELNNVTW